MIAIKEDRFREKGFGKDGKIRKTIVTFGLLTNRNKQPVVVTGEITDAVKMD